MSGVDCDTVVFVVRHSNLLVAVLVVVIEVGQLLIGGCGVHGGQQRIVVNAGDDALIGV